MKPPPWLRALVRSHPAIRAHPELDPDDLVADVLAALFEQSRSGRVPGPPFPPTPFVRRKARWLLSDATRRHLRGAARRSRESPDLVAGAADQAPGPDVMAERSQAMERAAARLRRAGEDVRAAAFLVLHGWTERQIADALSISPSSVHRKVARMGG